MFQLTYLWLGTFAILSTVGAMVNRLDTITRFFAAVFALAAWAVWTISSFEVLVVSSGVGYSETYVEMAALGAVATLLMLLITVRFGFSTIKSDSAPGPDMDGMEVRR